MSTDLTPMQATGKSKGFGFLCYEDQRSTILAVDNFNGLKLCKRTIRVDHVQTYKLPKGLFTYDFCKFFGFTLNYVYKGHIIRDD